MIYQGSAIQVSRLESGIARLCFDLPGSAVNVFNELMLSELAQAVTAIAASDVKGLICVSAKSSYVVGADIKEFTAKFKLSEAELLDWADKTNRIFNALEDLPIPTVSAINGMALGGGLEVCLATDFRVAVEQAMLGFPEVNLGICPGFGGTVRAPRLMNADNAIDLIRTGRPLSAGQALEQGIVDSVVSADVLEEAAEDLVQQALSGELDMTERRAQKTGALAMSPASIEKVFSAGLARTNKDAGPHYPAAPTAVDAMWQAADKSRAAALKLENEAFVALARGQVAGNLVQLFLNEQFLKSVAKKQSADAGKIQQSAVMGAGIMGGGIAYQSALRGVPIVMKDIAQQGLDLGLGEAGKLLRKQVERGRMSQEAADRVLTSISATLDYDQFKQVDFVVEAVVENVAVKKAVLAEVENVVRPETVLTSNTSTISITRLAEDLQRPENFCGMHFFNPVPLMPLVEVIRGQKTGKHAIANTVAYAQKLGKTPIVVNDCPGFLVNRILFPYFGAFCQLLSEGADFRDIDRVMEQFGWPMGPAYLLDVVGIDTASHCMKVMAEGFPDRMKYSFRTAVDHLYEAGSYGQKNGKGFYQYEANASGRPVKQFDESILDQLRPLQVSLRTFSDDEIRERMMLALCLEAVRCLEDNIVSSAAEVDMGLLLGLGYPRFRGGALRYIDNYGLPEFCAMADKYADLGALYHPTAGLREMAAADKTFY
ncbi:fatty acid oxidation complex subunit alpha FadB [Pseudohongiella spirulinae]|uniref:enoyl-CoA hydratase n=1 Tax=Pseudohongiella spirulinae TaxID=1249552 RepID=A0A0S2KCN1_9GAMM|nr:fatty acid oxidation complex subunit alpha FadB [Pseudohongiella spirulinae]ALO46077.1 multifunctional fatty acid oxidation complex subunit alpha [Pseudohongiella spirulinae]